MPKFTVDGGRLLADGAPVRQVKSPNVGGTVKPRFLVMHFTAGGAEGAIETLSKPGGVSAHFVIDEAGTVTQLVYLDRVAWHAGKSQWADVQGSLNPVSIGIELANYGELDGGPGAYTFCGRRVPDERVLVARHANGGPPRPWHTYPPAQIEAALAVAKALHEAFGFEDVVGHDQIAPDRKTDPGPAFPMASFRAAVLGAAPDAPAAPIASESSPGRSVTFLQRAMNTLGFGPIGVDGTFGDETEAAVRRFQEAKGLDVDGDPGPRTWKAIEAAMAEHKGGV